MNTATLKDFIRAAGPFADALKKLSGDVDTIEKIDSVREALQAECNGLSDQIDKARNELRATQAEGAKAVRDEEAKLEALKVDKGKELRSLQISIDQAKITLAECQAEVKAVEARHSQVLDSLESLKKSLNA